MFAPPVAKPKVNTNATAKGHSALLHGRLFEHCHGDGGVVYPPILQRSIGNQAVLQLYGQRGLIKNGYDKPRQDAGQESTTAKEGSPRGARDFSKIPLYQTGRISEYQPLSPFPAPRLAGAIQAKLKVGAVNDPLEHEANRVAEQILRMPDKSLLRACPCGNYMVASGECSECSKKTDWVCKASKEFPNQAVATNQERTRLLIR
jgi:hypothetical protein